ncbi:hypothetical protein RHS01_02020 [Rhizoctonia solani]|uniref:Uncharacterized protein n=1 Tax=Rhizoctonia solani TaxID=456999 RepID=A0A8H7IK30_9AGAM|nr:hypothetical protein RHS01_02020 [Rhizoctonia solani]
MSLQQYACRCLNITITSTTTKVNGDVAPTSPVHFEKVHVGDAGVKVPKTEAKIQWNTVSCLLCRTTVYRVSSEVSTDFELRDGLVVTPGRILQRARFCVAEMARNESTKYSETFGLLLPASPKPSTLPSTPQRPSSPQPPATPHGLNHICTYRAQAEQAIEAFIEGQVAQVLEKERHLRGQVEVIWSKWRENWKQEADSESPSEGHHPTLSGVVSMREFSPTRASESGPVGAQGSVAPQAAPARRTSMHTPGPSMLSQSLRQSNFVPPPQPVISTPSPELPAPVNGVKNPLDDSFAISVSLQIRNIDALRARESARDVEERRRNRLSLGGRPNTTPAVPEEQSLEDDKHVTSTSRNGVAEGKRKVTFQADVKEKWRVATSVPERRDPGLVNLANLVAALFDLDDDDEEFNQPSTETDQTADTTPDEPTTPRAVAQLKAKAKANKDLPKIGNKSAVPALLTVNLGPSPAKPKASLKSPPAAKLESPKTRTARPGEDKLLELVAANYPSHRAAWRPNGKAWSYSTPEESLQIPQTRHQ